MRLFSKKVINIYSPVDGELINLSDVQDEVFATEMLGSGLAFRPSSSEVRSPLKGILKSVFPTGHAYGIFNKASKIEILLHLGINTVELQGEGFHTMVKQGDKVKVNELLVKVDWDFIKSKNLPIDTPLVFLPNTIKGWKLNIIAKNGKVKMNELVAKLERVK